MWGTQSCGTAGRMHVLRFAQDDNFFVIENSCLLIPGRCW
jgi:hypothetical protein